MVAAKVTTFGGMIPAIEDHLLPDQAAAYSENAWLYSGSLIGLPEPKLLFDSALASMSKAYRLPDVYEQAAYLYDSTWLQFVNPDTDVVRAPVFDDVHDRYYWASSSDNPRYNTRARIELGQPAWLLGIPAPTSAPVITNSLGSGVQVTRSYVVTYVTTYGEEGPPSPAATATYYVDGTWSIARPAATAGDLGVDRTISDYRIYRTVTSNTGVATFYLVTQLPIATASYNDTLLDAVVTIAGDLKSAAWSPPPYDLEGMIAMPNGILAGWRGSEVWFSEPYRPHAWPAAYVHTVEHPVIGLGVNQQTLVICTVGYPMTAYGSSPGSITTSKLMTGEPCTSRGSILSTPEGVYYASPNGLVLVSSGRAENITKDLITKDRWTQLTGNTSLRAARLGTAYYGFGSVIQGVFNTNAFDVTAFISADFTGSYTGVLIDPANQRVAFTTMTSDTPMYNVYNDQWSGEVFEIKNGDVYWLDLSDVNVPRQVTTWRSKKFQTNSPSNIGAVKVYFDVSPSAPVLGPVRNTANNQELAASQYGIIRFFADNRLVVTRELRKSGELFKLPSGFKADYWQFEIVTRVKIKSVQFASSAKELVAV